MDVKRFLRGYSMSIILGIFSVILLYCVVRKMVLKTIKWCHDNIDSEEDVVSKADNNNISQVLVTGHEVIQLQCAPLDGKPTGMDNLGYQVQITDGGNDHESETTGSYEPACVKVVVHVNAPTQ